MTVGSVDADSGTPRSRGWAGTAAAMRAVPFVLMFVACAGPPAADGRWFGTMTPSPAKPGCDPARASLSVTRGAALFAPDEGTWTLQGTAAGGAINAERTGTGANKQPYPTRFSARLGEGGIAGTYTTPRCSFAVKLARQ